MDFKYLCTCLKGYKTNDKSNFNKHVKVCAENLSETKIAFKDSD
jgi:hypothetical protein